jgi:hypothetical protein
LRSRPWSPKIFQLFWFPLGDSPSHLEGNRSSSFFASPRRQPILSPSLTRLSSLVWVSLSPPSMLLAGSNRRDTRDCRFYYSCASGARGPSLACTTSPRVTKSAVASTPAGSHWARGVQGQRGCTVASDGIRGSAPGREDSQG